MSRLRPDIRIEVVPLETDGAAASRAWIRACEILLRAKARQAAKRAVAEGGIPVITTVPGQELEQNGDGQERTDRRRTQE